MNEFLNFVTYFLESIVRNEPCPFWTSFKARQPMSGSDLKDNTAMCPQCRTEMVHVAVTPHPVVRNMQRNTFVCYTCKRTRTYMLPGTFTPEMREGTAAQKAS
jgi:uncharacterized protein with PIN domain